MSPPEATCARSTISQNSSVLMLFLKNFFTFVAVRFHLAQDHRMVATASAHQFVVGTALNNPAVFHQQNQVGATDGGEAVGDDEGGAPGKQISHGSLDELFAFRVEVAGGFVENQDLR